MDKKRTKIHRQAKSDNYTIIHNEILRRDDVSWKAKGIMCYILSLPDNWEIYLEELMKHATDGRDSFRSGWTELKDKGYVSRIPVKENGKFVEWRTEIVENVGLADSLPLTDFPIVEKPIVGKPLMEKPILDNPTLLSTNGTNDLSLLSTDDTNNKVDSKNESDYTSPKSEQFEEIWKLYPSSRRRNKKGCKAKFDKVVKSQTDIDFIRADVMKYINYTVLASVSDSYIATTQTYFNQERWNDENTYEVTTQPSRNQGSYKQPTRKETLPDWTNQENKETPVSEEEQDYFKKQLAEMRGRAVNHVDE